MTLQNVDSDFACAGSRNVAGWAWCVSRVRSCCGVGSLIAAARCELRTLKVSPLRTLNIASAASADARRIRSLSLWHGANSNIESRGAEETLQTSKHRTCKNTLARDLVDPGREPQNRGCSHGFCTQTFPRARRPYQEILSEILLTDLREMLRRDPVKTLPEISCPGPSQGSFREPLLRCKEPRKKSRTDPQGFCSQIVLNPTKRSCQEIVHTDLGKRSLSQEMLRRDPVKIQRHLASPAVCLRYHSLFFFPAQQTVGSFAAVT